MLMYPEINPVAISLGPFKIHWYGLMYAFSFIFVDLGGKLRLKMYPHSFLTPKLIDDFLFYGAFGTVIGGRLGYCLFYKPLYFLTHPLHILMTWEGGMSFHGGLLGVIFAIYLFARKNKHTFYEVCDFMVPLVPVCILFGRIGNFINGELWGRFTTASLPWGMVYPQSGSLLPRHPSQIYEILGEGIILTIITWVYAAKPRKLGQVSGVFAMGYGLIRFILEYFREPDSFLIEFARQTGLSMGQWLCIPLFVAGVLVYYFATIQKNPMYTNTKY